MRSERTSRSVADVGNESLPQQRDCDVIKGYLTGQTPRAEFDFDFGFLAWSCPGDEHNASFNLLWSKMPHAEVASKNKIYNQRRGCIKQMPCFTVLLTERNQPGLQSQLRPSSRDESFMM